MNHYQSTTGRSYTQKQIDRKYSQSIREKHIGKTVFICEGCGLRADHNDHTISRKRCKEIGKVELIWDKENFVSSCAKCHNEWESYKSGLCRNHTNYVRRMEYIKKHDIELYIKRIEL